MASETDVSVRQRIDVDLSAKEVRHALRCYLAHVLAERASVPTPSDFSAIIVDVSADMDGNLLGATMTYAPKIEEPTDAE